MKKYICLIPIILIFICIGCKKEEKIMREGIVNFLSGSVYTTFEGERKEVLPGDVITEGMKIETGKKSFMDIYFGGTAVKIMENSTVDVKLLVKYLKSEIEKSQFFLRKGKIFSRVKNKLSKGSEFTIATPTTTAGVRGTEFLVTQEEDRGKIACLKGKIFVKNEESPEIEPVEVNNEEEVVVVKGQKMMVRALSEQSRKDINKIVKNFKEMNDDIRKKFLERREELLKDVKEGKLKNKEIIKKHRKAVKQDVEDVKNMAKSRVDETKDIMKNNKKGVKEMTENLREQLKGGKKEILKDVTDMRDSILSDKKKKKKTKF